MPDIEELQGIQAIANVIASLPPQQPGGPRIPLAPPKVAQWAAELYRDFGMRIHPELAKKEIVASKDPLMGNFSPRTATDVVDMKGLLDMLRTVPDVPELAKLADEIEEATGDKAKEQVLIARIRKQYPDVIATAKHRAAQAPPEAFE